MSSIEQTSNPQTATEGRQSPLAEKQADSQIGHNNEGAGLGKQDLSGPKKSNQRQRDSVLTSNPGGPLDQEAQNKLRHVAPCLVFSSAHATL